MLIILQRQDLDLSHIYFFLSLLNLKHTTKNAILLICLGSVVKRSMEIIKRLYKSFKNKQKQTSLQLKKIHKKEMRKLQGSWKSSTVLELHSFKPHKIKLDTIQGKREIFLFLVADFAWFAIHLEQWWTICWHSSSQVVKVTFFNVTCHRISCHTKTTWQDRAKLF